MNRVCSICQFETRIDRQYCLHMLKFHKSEANFKVICALCNRSYDKENYFRKNPQRKHKENIRENDNYNEQDQEQREPDDHLEECEENEVGSRRNFCCL